MDNKVCQSGGVFSEVVYGEILMKTRRHTELDIFWARRARRDARSLTV